MLIPFGILSSAGALREGTYELISTTVLTGSATSVTFSNLGDYSTTYRHLQIRAVTRSTNTTGYNEHFVTLNGDTGNNYASHTLGGNGSSAFSNASTSRANMSILPVAGTQLGSNIFGATITDFLDAYSTTKNKTIRNLGGIAPTLINLNSGFRNNTASITSITYTSSGGFSYVAGSRFSLYGIRG